MIVDAAAIQNLLLESFKSPSRVRNESGGTLSKPFRVCVFLACVFKVESPIFFFLGMLVCHVLFRNGLFCRCVTTLSRLLVVCVSVV